MRKFASLALVVLFIAAFMVPAAFACGDRCQGVSAHRVTPPTSISFELPAELGGSGSFYEPPVTLPTTATEDTTGDTGAEQPGSSAGGEQVASNTGEKQTGSSAGGEQSAATEATEPAATEPTAPDTPAVDPAAAAAATPSVDTPKTGDDSHTILWAAISLVTLGAIGVVALPLVKKTKVED